MGVGRMNNHINFYPRSPCGERLVGASEGAAIEHISIHALLAESDLTNVVSSAGTMGISIHALLAESDLAGMSDKLIGSVFLSTLSLRRATGRTKRLKSRLCVFLSTLSLRRATVIRKPTTGRNNHFYPRSPCGERPDGLIFFCRRNRISIHALLAESDGCHHQL